MDHRTAAHTWAAVSRWCARAGVALAKTLIAVLLLCLVVAALVWTSGYVLEPGPYVEKGITDRDRLWVTLPIAALVAAGIVTAERFLARSRWGRFDLRRTVCHVVLAEALVWSFMTLQVPWADMQSTVETGIALTHGRHRRLYDGYLETYPFQLGLVGYFQLLAMVFGDWTLYVVKILNALYVALTVGVLARVADELWRDRRVTRTFLLLCPLFLPLAMHSVQVYGDSPARLLSACAILCTVRYLRGRSIRWLLPAVAALAVAYVLRQNVVIVAVAIGLVLLVKALREVRWAAAAAAAALLLIPAPALAVRAAYESYYQLDFGPGLPTSAWLYIGLGEGNHDAGWYEPGIVDYWNFYSDERPMTDLYARQVIDKRLSNFAEHPMYAADFFRRKFVSQWADPDFEVTRLSTLQPATFGRRSNLAESLLYGEDHRVLWTYLDGLQSLLGLAAAGWAAYRLRRASLPVILPAVAVLGGALFHMAWEAKARYAFEYYPYVLLYAAAGLALASSHLQARWRLRRASRPVTGPAREGRTNR